MVGCGCGRKGHLGRGAFAPSDGRGAVGSAQIEAGKYHVENVPPGKKIVQIIGVKQIDFPKTHEEAAEAAKRSRGALPETADEVPADAQGNNQPVDTVGGDQELNFDLKKPSVHR